MPRLGLISDTHGLLRPEALAFLRGCERIVHGGDIDSSEVLEQLASIAPVTAVRGNHDRGPWADALPETDLFEFHGAYIYLIHHLAQIDIEPSAAGVQAVVHGHSHKPAVERRDGVLFVNPGSAGPRRFTLPISVAELIVTLDGASARVVELAVNGAA